MIVTRVKASPCRASCGPNFIRSEPPSLFYFLFSFLTNNCLLSFSEHSSSLIFAKKAALIHVPEEMNPKIHRPVSSQPRRSAAERCGRRQVEMRSEMLGITGDSSTDLVEPIDNAGTGLQITETLSSEWTDEKHCLYLNFMEASFVKQLYSPDYRSIDLLGHHSSLINPPDPSSLHSNANNSIPSSQFKVIQGGSLKRINFERARPKLNSLNNSHLLLENQWVRHFRSTRKQKVALSNMQEKSTSSSESICSIGQKKSIPGAATCSKEINAGMHHQNSICNGAEVSDQNFIDEEHEAKQISRLCPSKKTDSAY